MEQLAFYSAVVRSKEADGMANSVDPNHTAPKEQCDLGLHCLVQSDLSSPIFRIIRANR